MTDRDSLLPYLIYVITLWTNTSRRLIDFSLTLFDMSPLEIKLMIKKSLAVFFFAKHHTFKNNIIVSNFFSN